MEQEKITKILDNISKKSKVPVDELEKEYKVIFDGLPPSDDREKQALKDLNNKHVGVGDDKTEDHEIIVLGVRNLTDFNAKTITEVLDKYSKDQEGMLESGRVKLMPVDVNQPEGKKEPKAIDMQESFQFNGETIKNPNFGKPLGPKFNSNTLVLARKPGDVEWVQTTFALRDNHATDFDAGLMFTPLTVNCLGDIASGLKTGRSTKFNPIQDMELNISQLIASTCGDHVHQLEDVYAYTETLDSKDYDRFVVTSGTVQSMYPPKTEGNSANGKIDDITTDGLVQIFVDSRLPMPSVKEEYSFICQPAIKEAKDKDKKPTGEMQLILNVMGYY